MGDVAPARRGVGLWIAIGGAGVLAAGSAWWLLNALPRGATPAVVAPPPASAVGYTGPRLGEVASVPTWGRAASSPGGGTKPSGR
ncbi:MAG: hypothetical protein HY021_09460 [Burkholderiales bacterium]|nr:hypothetical protein [Burkholderiales bacterium]